MDPKSTDRRIIKRILVVSAVLFFISAEIGPPVTFTAGTAIVANDMNGNFSTLYNEINGSLDAFNLAADPASLGKVTDGVMAVSGSNIGVGTANPRVKLDLGSTLLSNGTHFNGQRVQLVIDDSFSGIALGNADDATMYGYGMISVSETNNANFHYWTILSDSYDADGGNFRIKHGTDSNVHGFSTYFTILNDSGNVGIGTASPEAMLDI